MIGISGYETKDHVWRKNARNEHMSNIENCMDVSSVPPLGSFHMHASQHQRSIHLEVRTNLVDHCYRTENPAISFVLFLDDPGLRSGRTIPCRLRIPSAPRTHCISHPAMISLRSSSGTSPCLSALVSKTTMAIVVAQNAIHSIRVCSMNINAQARALSK